MLGIGYFGRVHHLAYYLFFQICSGFMQVGLYDLVRCELI